MMDAEGNGAVEDARAPVTSPRRGFLFAGIVWVLRAVTAALVGIPGLRFLATPLSVDVGDGTAWVTVGPAAALRGTDPVAFRYRQRWQDGHRTATAIRLVFVRREAGELVALSGRCTHLGCPVGWQTDRFRCPCHQGEFDRSGRVLSGPPSRPLPRLQAREEAGVIQVRVV
jgi:Rieske Fe-S protein